MSFAGEVKDELSHQLPHSRHCQIAELTAIITMCGGVSISVSDRLVLKLRTENIYVVRKAAALIGRLFHISCEVSVRRRRQKTFYLAVVSVHEDAVRILQTVHLLQGNDQMAIMENMHTVDSLIIQRSCCKRAFLRGAFLTSGSITDPNSDYHLELNAQTQEKAAQLCGILESLGLEAHITSRRHAYVVYLKEGDQISDLLGLMEASRALLEMENIRIYKSIGNSINRQVNCETANLHKTVTAAVSSIKDIEELQKNGVFSELEEPLQITARLRLENPDASLAVLAGLHNPPIGKSGVNHRLKKISALAAVYRTEG